MLRHAATVRASQPGKAARNESAVSQQFVTKAGKNTQAMYVTRRTLTQTTMVTHCAAGTSDAC